MPSNAHLSVQERSDFGKSLRKQIPRSSHGEWNRKPDLFDPIQLLEEQNKARLPWLVPVRRGRMKASPFAFYRGSARLMAADLSQTPNTGMLVQACGDAHLANFGLFASPERNLVFDLNDFDETLEGPWEWDLKRLAVSFTIAARHIQLDRKQCLKVTAQVLQSYRESMHEFAEWRTTDIWYAQLSAKDCMAAASTARTQKRVEKLTAKSLTKDSRQALDKLAEYVDGQYRIRSEPPLLLPLRELNEWLDITLQEDLIKKSYQQYLNTVSTDCRVLLKKFQPVDFGLKVVGVGSVGTRCWILLLEGRDQSDPLFLQMKEATHSVLAEYLQPSQYENAGRRVVEGQRLMQTTNDIFLGWNHTDETGRDYYWRQLRDWKGSVDIETIDANGLNIYAHLCGWTLARAHARSGDPVAIAAYLGSSDRFGQAVVNFAEAYADQNERDYQAFVSEIQNGHLDAAEDLR